MDKFITANYIVLNVVNLRKQKISKQKQPKTTVKCFKVFVLFVEQKSQRLRIQKRMKLQSQAQTGEKPPMAERVLLTTFRLRCIYPKTSEPEEVKIVFTLKPIFFGKGTEGTKTSGDSANSDENFEVQFEA